ncbi:MAG: group 1 glycosyl transferase [Elusimicrobia bacterium]|nr:MAG: group 1 glycosyl transferase [Elusimicrobiota bacterium]KAF0157993.1 MAG: group 1 glycosyl transferase [Elusimicrobiota bacterium]
MIKIAYVIPSIEVGGTEKHLLTLIRNLDRGDFEPILITTTGGGGLYEDFRQTAPVFIFGGENHKARKTPSLNPFIHFETVRGMAAVMRERRIDIAHCYLPAANVLGPLAGKLAGVGRIIVSKRSLPDYKKGHPVISRLESAGNFCSATVMCNSEAVRKETERTEFFWRGKMEVVYNGVGACARREAGAAAAFRKREGLPEGAMLAVCVSNFFAYKGHLELTRAAAIVKKEFPHLIFLLAGRDAGSMEKVKALARELDVTENLRFMGVRTDVADLLGASDIFVHPSRQEGFSNSVLEAMAAGLPVVACAVGGNTEAVTQEATGLLVPREDHESLAGAILRLLRNPAERKAMGEAGRKKAEETFSIARMVSGIEGLYRKTP